MFFTVTCTVRRGESKDTSHPRSMPQVYSTTFGYLMGFALANSMGRRISPADNFRTDGVAKFMKIVLPSLTLLHPQRPRSFTT